MKKLIYLILCIGLLASFVGCKSDNKSEEYYETTLSFEKDGKVNDVIVESFTEDYYSEDGLKAYFQEKISEYNSGNIGNGEVNLDSLEVKDGRATATLLFDSSDTYSSFYDTPAFYGSISDAYDKGLISETVLKKYKSNETISKVDLMKMKDEYIIVISEVVRVRSPKKIIYTSANVEVIDEKNARVSSDSTGLAYIVVK